MKELDDDPVFHQSVSGKMYRWLLEEQDRRGAESVQEVVRQILREAMEARRNV